MSVPHETRPVKVWEYINTIPGVRTEASCQGTLGEGGPNPYRPQVLVVGQTQEAIDRLKREFDVTIPEDCNGTWFYVHPKSG